MKYLESYNENELPILIQRDVKDICLELTDQNFICKLSYILDSSSEWNHILSIYKPNYHPFDKDIVTEVIERIKDFLLQNGYFLSKVIFSKVDPYWGDVEKLTGVVDIFIKKTKKSTFISLNETFKYLKTFEELQKVLSYESGSGKTKNYDIIYDDPSSPKSPSSSVLLKKQLKEQEFQDIMKLLSELPEDIVKSYIKNPDDKRMQNLLITSNNMKFLKDKSKEGELRCEYCGKGPLIIYEFGEVFNWKNGATCDHKEPQSKGGEKFNYKNLAVCCRRCNSNKGDMSYSEWMKRINP